MKSYNVIGIMSGTSLDGVDIAYCTFSETEGKWSYNIKYAELYKYSEYWNNTLLNLENSSAFDFVNINIRYGHYIGKLVKGFIEKFNVNPDFIASHGHTVFHQPNKLITCQIGDGAAIAAECGHIVVCDFRSIDVALGGQGAPLVPIGDKLLFAEYDFCLNLGGIANISFDKENKRIAFDICPANMVLNRIAEKLGKTYDENGLFASKGQVNINLFNKLNDLDYYKTLPPKSLGKEWVMKYFFSIIEQCNLTDYDKLCTN